jgi:hypothetical protein
MGQSLEEDTKESHKETPKKVNNNLGWDSLLKKTPRSLTKRHQRRQIIIKDGTVS